MDKKSQIAELNKKWGKYCSCPLRKTATQSVFGDGDTSAQIVFIGEAPGAKEDLAGKPFVGAAGKFLNELLGDIKIKREEVYITNIVKYRPPNNRDPLPEEIATCAKWLEDELSIIDPMLIVLLGRHAMNHFFPAEKISLSHGKIFTAECFKKTRHFLHLYHPAAALYNGSLREVLKKDFKKIPAILKKIALH